LNQSGNVIVLLMAMPRSRASSGVSSCQYFRNALEPRAVMNTEMMKSTAKPAAYLARSIFIVLAAMQKAMIKKPKR
jgi:hypothetical protein